MIATAAPATTPAGRTSEGRRLYRHRSDVARFVFNVVLLGAFALLGWLAPSGLRSFGLDVIQLVETLPLPLVEGLVGVVQLLAVALPVLVAGVLVWRRSLVLLAILTAAATLAAVSMAVLSGAFEDTVPVDELAFERIDTWFIGGQFPSSTYLCALTAVFVAAAPWLTKRWRHAGWIFIAAAVLSRVLTATEVPIRIGMLLTLGATCGSLALVAIGAPRRRVDAGTVAGALADAGVEATDVQAGTDTGGVPTFTATTSDGSRLFVRVFGRDERDTDLLLQAWRRFTRRGLGDDVEPAPPRREVEHEALALALFASAGASVPAALALTTTLDETAVLVTSLVDGPTLDQLPGDEVGDELLDAIWRQVAHLQVRRLAHRRLNAEHIIVADGRPVLVDLRQADVTASDEVLGADVAELLASLATLVGADRAVAAAARTLRPEHLARAVPLVQLPVLSPQVRKAYRSDKQALTDLRNRAAAAAGVDEVQLAPVSRITVKGAVSLAGSLVLVYYLISLAANWEDIWDAFTQASVAYVVPILALTAATYVAGAVSLVGAVTVQLGLLRTTAVMFGQSFLNRFTPANAGGMAMRMRYLQLNGLELPVAAASIGLTSAANGVVQGVFIVVFFVWGGTSDRFSDFEFPDIGTILIVVVALGLVATAVLYSRWGRDIIRPWVRGTVAKLKSTFGELARNPTKMAQLFGGAALSKLCNIVSFWLSGLAFDVGLSFPKAGALYMIANTVGSAVPTPGGVGGIEAALTAVLIAFGVDSATAAAMVLFFRILTFWVPTAPGYGFLQYTQRRGIV